MSRFVLLYHACPAGLPRSSHWDLMLEQEEILRTWALVQLPCDWISAAAQSEASPQPADTNTVSAEPLGDHRLAYLDYEGPLSEDRGHVTRVEAGTYASVEQTPDRWDVSIVGRELRGRITLSRVTTEHGGWQLTYWPTGDDS
jgi:hypothetical protein